MSIGANELKHIQFGKEFRGYQKNAVDHLMSKIAHEFDAFQDKINKLEYTLAKTETELNRLKEVETVMFKAMKEANDNAAKVLAQAKTDSETLLTNASIEADDLILEAKDQARTIITNAQNESQQLLAETNQTIEALKNEAKIDLEASEMEYNSLDFAKKQLIEDLNSLLGNTTSRLSNLESKYNPETFNARKVSLGKLRKAGLAPSQSSEAKPEQPIKANPKSTSKPSKSKVDTTKKPIAKPKKVAKKTTDDETGDLPTVSKILAAEAGSKYEKPIANTSPAALEVSPELIPQSTDNEGNKSFFDLV
jgi:cell division initiation protein